MLELTIPITVNTPLIQLKALHIIIQPELGGDPRVPVELSADLTGKLGILSVAVERIGLVAEIFLEPEPRDPTRTVLGHGRS